MATAKQKAPPETEAEAPPPVIPLVASWTLGDKNFPFRAPKFKDMAEISESVTKILEASGVSELLNAPWMDHVLAYALGERYDEFMELATPFDGWDAVNAYIAFGRFADFLAMAESTISKRSAERIMASGNEEMLEALKTKGMLPADFSLANVLKERVSGLMEQSLDGVTGMSGGEADTK
jgi:hypothetical protein